MTSPLRAAIALATWNGERFLEEQLNSYLVQTRLPDELVVSDDRSRDRTLDVVREFAAKAPFEVRILENADRIGYAANFGRAIEACRADVILLSDQDDVWLPMHVEKLVQPFVDGVEGRKEGRKKWCSCFPVRVTFAPGPMALAENGTPRPRGSGGGIGPSAAATA